MDERMRLIIRRIIAIFMSALMAVVVLPLETRADEDTNGDYSPTEEPAYTETEEDSWVEEPTVIPEYIETEAPTEYAPEEYIEPEPSEEPDGAVIAAAEDENEEPETEEAEEVIISEARYGTVLYAVEDPEEEPDEVKDGKAVFDELMSLNPDKTMEDIIHPLGYGDNLEAALKRSKCMLYFSSSADKGQPNSSWMGWQRGYTAGKGLIFSEGSWDSNWIKWYGTERTGTIEDMGEYGRMSFLQAVSFDPTGSGKNDFVAYIGMERDINNGDKRGYRIWMYVMNMHTHQVSNRVLIGNGNTHWMEDAFDKGELFARNYFSITAGDFDADGKDTLIVYCAEDAGEHYFTEYEVTGLSSYPYADSEEYSQNGMIDDSIGFTVRGTDSKELSFIDPSYKISLNSSMSNPAQRIMCDMSTGDVTRDGIEDLIIVTGSEISKRSYLVVIPGGTSLSSVIKNPEYLGTVIEMAGNSMISAGVDVGKINNDFIPDIMTAGYLINTSSGAKTADLQMISGFNVSEDGRSLVMFAWSQDTPYLTNHQPNSRYVYTVWGQIQVKLVAFDGLGLPEKLCTDKKIYDCANGIKSVYTASAPANTAVCTGGYAGNYVFRANEFNDVTASTAFEQLSITTTEMEWTTTSGGRWEVYLSGDIISGNAAYDDKGVLTPCTKFTPSETASQKPFHDAAVRDDYVFGKDHTINLLIVPFETDKDEVIIARLNKENGRKTLPGAPEAIAVLQAAPYFKETGEAYAGSTTFGIIETVGDGRNYVTTNYIGGGITQASQWPIGRQSLAVTLREQTSDSVLTQTVQKYTSTFAAAAKDTVVIRMSPIDVYQYDTLWNSYTEWEDKSLGLTVMRPPVYHQISVDEYNALVEYYNRMCDENVTEMEGQIIKAPKLYPIDKEALYLGNEGNPSAYAKTGSTKVPNGWWTISKGTYALGYHGGTTTSNYLTETTQTTTHSSGLSWDFRFEVDFGGLNKDTGWGFWMGLFFNAGGSEMGGKIKLEGSGVQTSGMVKNLDADKNEGLLNYGFDWVFGGTELILKEQEPPEPNPYDPTPWKPETVPVYGYTVANVKRGLDTPVIDQITKKTDTDNHIICTVSWSGPEVKDGQKITAFDVYGYDIDGTKRHLGTVSGDTHSYDFVRTDEDFISFTVAAHGEQNGTEIAGVESNKKSVFFVSDGIPGPKGDKGDQGIPGEQGPKGDQGEPGASGQNGVDGKSAYQLAVDGGYTGTLEEWLESLKGADGADGKDGVNGLSAYEIAVQGGYQGSQDEWLASLKGDKGENGQNGADGKSAYQLAVDGGYTGTLEEWLESLKGADGTNGKDGINGLSAYEIAVQGGYQGTQAEWLASLKGDKGDKGDQGIQGIKGDSAFDLALQAGFVGTLEDWLLFLRGKDGKDGADGRDGADGLNGRDGMDGHNGANGMNGLNGLNGTNGIDGRDGVNGRDGMSAYEIALANGFVGTQQEWLESLKGTDGANGVLPATNPYGIANAYVDENEVLIIPLADGRKVHIGQVEDLNDPKYPHDLKLKSIDPKAGIRGFLKDWLPLILALLSLIWNAFDLYLIVMRKKNRKKLA